MGLAVLDGPTVLGLVGAGSRHWEGAGCRVGLVSLVLEIPACAGMTIEGRCGE